MLESQSHRPGSGPGSGSGSSGGEQRSWWQCLILLAVGVGVASLPFLTDVPRPFDKFVFGFGAISASSAIIALLFPEVRFRTSRGRIPFYSRGRMFAALALAVVSFLVICSVSVFASLNGWWR